MILQLDDSCTTPQLLTARGVRDSTMQNLITLLIATTCLFGPRVAAAAYSTEATMSLQKDEGTYMVGVRVSRLVERNGKLTEKVIAEPRIQSAPGVPATLYSGLRPGNPNYTTEENVTVNVTWPYPNESGVAYCTVTIKQGDMVVSKSKLQLKIEGPGRIPLVIMPQDVDPKSVQIVDEAPKTYVLVEFVGRTKEEIRKLANENYGNRVQIRDSQGRLTEGGTSFGLYHKIGMTLHYNTSGEAKHVANILRGEETK